MLDVNTENLGRHADERAADGGACVPGCPARSRHEPKLRGHEVRGSAHYRAGWDIHGIPSSAVAIEENPRAAGCEIRVSCHGVAYGLPSVVRTGQSTVTTTSWTRLFPQPSMFHGCSSGCGLPAASVARQVRTCSPGDAVQSYDQRRQANSPTGSSSLASSHAPSTPNSTRTTGAVPHQARPITVTGPAGATRRRLRKS